MIFRSCEPALRLPRKRALSPTGKRRRDRGAS